MDIEKLIEAVKLCGSTPKVDQCKKCTHWAGGDMSKCIPRMTEDAATALSTLQAENEKLRAELEQVKREKDAAASDLESVMAYRGDNLDTCQFCKNGQCHVRGGQNSASRNGAARRRADNGAVDKAPIKWRYKLELPIRLLRRR